jgi:cyanophycinase
MIAPKGKLIAIGGAEDKGTDLELGLIHRNNLNFFELGILKRILTEVKGEESHIEVITTASSTPNEVSENYSHAFAKLGCHSVGHLRIRNREDAVRPDYIQRMQKADAIMLSGGNQLRLTSIFGGTEFLKLLTARYENEEGFVIAGTSAGAMAMSGTMIYEGNAARAHIKGEIKITAGLGFNNQVIFDSHFDKRGRFGRLVQAIAANPSCLGVGLGEDTGVVIKNGIEFEALGSGMVVIIDGQKIRHSNIADQSDGSPISIENLIVHVLAHGDKYNLSDHHFGAAIEMGYTTQ